MCWTRASQVNLDFAGVQRCARRIRSRDTQIRMKGKPEDSVVKTQLDLANAGSNTRESTTVPLAAQSDPLRELSNGPINSQDGGRIWLLCVPLDGLTHHGPPHASYTGLCEPTATKR